MQMHPFLWNAKVRWCGEKLWDKYYSNRIFDAKGQNDKGLKG